MSKPKPRDIDSVSKEEALTFTRREHVAYWHSKKVSPKTFRFIASWHKAAEKRR